MNPLPPDVAQQFQMMVGEIARAMCSTSPIVFGVIAGMMFVLCQLRPNHFWFKEFNEALAELKADEQRKAKEQEEEGKRKNDFIYGDGEVIEMTFDENQHQSEGMQ